MDFRPALSYSIQTNHKQLLKLGFIFVSVLWQSISTTFSNWCAVVSRPPLACRALRILYSNSQNEVYEIC